MTTSTAPAPALDLTNLTLGETAEIEELTGQAVTAMADDTAPKAKLMAAMLYVVKRRSDPEFTWEDALNSTMADLSEVLGSETDPKEISA